MTKQDIIDYCLKKPGAFLDYPYGEQPVCLRIRAGNKRPTFVHIHYTDTKLFVTVKCDPYEAMIYRNTYPGTVRRGYYCPPSQQPYWNTVDIGADVSDEEIYMMFDRAGEKAVGDLPKYLRKEFGR